MWWRLTILGLATVTLIVLCTVPMTTVTVSVDMPPGSSVSQEHVRAAVKNVTFLANVVFTVAILGVAGWLARGIVRKHRKPRA